MLKHVTNFTFFLLLTFSVISCGSDTPDCDNEAALEEFTLEILDKYLAAVDAFTADPSDSNCKTLRDATNDFIDDIESLSDCVDSADQADFDELILNANQSFDVLDCD